MAGDRVVKVSLTAQVSNYISGMEQARKKTQETSKSTEDLNAKFAEQQQAMSQVGAGLTAIGAIAAVGVGLAIKKFADFDEAMSNVKAATQESAENMALLRDAALDAGARTVFSATEAANAVEELGKAGLSTADILNGGLDGALDLAAAGGLGVADAAGIAAVALKTFGLRGQDMAHVADLLAAGAGKAMGDVTDLSSALAQSGQVAASTGVSIEETTAVLAAFASKGLLGSDAGTSFKSMLQRLTPQSKEAARAMEELGISAYDANGEFIGMEAFAGNLAKSMKDLTTEQRNSAMAQIFGSDAVRAANVLYEEGAEGIAKWTESVNDTGYASRVAADRLDNLKGDVEALGGAFDTALIKSASGADDALRFLVQAATALVDIFNEAHPAVQQGVLVLGVLTAGVGLAGGAMLVAIPKIAEFRLALATLSTSTMPGVAAAAVGMQSAIGKAGTVMAATAKFLTGPWGIALLAAAVGVKVLTDHVKSMQASTEDLQAAFEGASSAADVFMVSGKGRTEWFQTLGQAKTSLGDLDVVLEKAANQSKNLWSRLGDSSIGPALQQLKSLGETLGTMADTDLPSAQEGFRLLAAETDGSQQSMWRLLSEMPAYRDALETQALSLGLIGANTSEAARKAVLLDLAFGDVRPTALDAADAYLQAADEASGLTDQLMKLLDIMNQANEIGQDAVSANATYQDSLAGITTEVEAQKEAYEKANGSLSGFTFSLDESTVAGSANAAMLAAVAADAQTAASAQYELDKQTMSGKEATDKYVATLAASRQALIDQAIANGATADEVQNLADKVYSLPTQKEIEILAHTAGAERQINDFVSRMNGKTIHIATGAGGAGGITRADGGAIYGPGGPRDDKIPAWLSNGEHVLDAEDVQRMGGQQAVYRFRESLYRGYADGGAIQYAPPTYMSAPSVSSGPSFDVVLSQKGGVDLLKYVDVAIVRSDRESGRIARAGRQVR